MGCLAVAFTAVMAVLCATSYTLPSPSVNYADRSALFGLLYAMGFDDACVASALDTCVSAPQESQSTPSVPPAHESHLFNLLHALGYSDTCIASALDACAGVSQEGQCGTLLKEARALLQETIGDLLQHVAPSVSKLLNARHCKDLLDAGDVESGVRMINPYLDPAQPERRLRVYCDQTTDGGGWTVFQRRTNTTVRENFYRGWNDYAVGFGNIEEEFWLGLDALHALTSTEPQELRIDLADWEGEHRYAKYGTFSVDGPTEKYRLTVGGYSGTANDSLTYHSGRKFSTHDSDNDSHGSYNCAADYRGAWWYGLGCHQSNLNGYQYDANPSEAGKGINWLHWRGYKYSLRRTTMMIRPTPGSG